MEGRRDDDTGEAAPPGRRSYGRRGEEGGGDECDDGSSGGVGVELSLRLRTGSSPPTAAPEAVVEQQEAAARRSMTIFYDGRVCAVDVTDIQAREIISMANREILADRRRQQHHHHHREDRHLQDRGSSTTTSGGQAMMRPGAAAANGYPRQGLATMAAAPVMTDQARLSMKRSLQRFLQKREARRAAAVAPPYAAGGRQAQAMRH